ncbi:peptidase, S54 family, partial [Cooperia oncophora]
LICSRKNAAPRASNVTPARRPENRYDRLPGSIAEARKMFDKGRHEMMCQSEVECTSWIRLFRAFDLDHDGFIPTTDLKRAIRDSAFSFGLNPEEVVTMLATIDENGDKLIDFPEFCTLMSQAKHRRLLRLMFRAAKFVVPRSKRTEPFDYLQKYKCCPPPVFMLIISIIQVAIYIYYTVESDEGLSITGPVPTKISSDLQSISQKRSVAIYNLHVYPYWVRDFTNVMNCVYYRIYHITYNVLTQLLLGVPLELVHQWRVIVVYLAGVLSVSSLLVSAVDPHVFLAGASGGVYALLAAHLAELIMNWVRGVSVYQRYFVDKVDRVSYVSHIGGFVAGVLLGVVVLRNFRRHPWERRLWWASLVAFAFFIAICVVLIIARILLNF